MRISKAVAALSLAACLVPFGASQAAPISVFNTLAEWQAAAGSPVILEDFSDATLAPGISFDSGTVGTAFLDTAPAPGAPLPAGLSFGPGITAFSADWILNTNVAQLAVLVAFVDGTTSGALLVNETPGTVFQTFFGLVFDAPVANLSYFSGPFGGQFVMDNIRFVPAGDDTVSVPEPSTVTLMMLSLLGLWAGRAFRRGAN